MSRRVTVIKSSQAGKIFLATRVVLSVPTGGFCRWWFWWIIGWLRVNESGEIHMNPRPGAKEFKREEGADAEPVEFDMAASISRNFQVENSALAGCEVVYFTANIARIELDVMAMISRFISYCYFEVG